TLIFSQIFYVIIFTWANVTGGENGLIFTRPHLTIPFIYNARFTTTTMHWFVLAVVTASYLILRRVTQSPFGMVLQSIRENEPRTRAIGYPVARYKMLSVMLSGDQCPYLIPLGIVFIVMIIFLPQGLLGFARRWLNR